MSSNLMISATPKFQVSGFDTDYFINNINVDTGTKVCGPATLGGLSGNTFLALQPSETRAQNQSYRTQQQHGECHHK
jgi:hypothetical protein